VNPVKKHPNTAVAIVSTFGLGTAVVKVADHFGAHLSAEEGLAIAGGIVTLALFIGRNGFEGIKNVILHGTNGNG